LSSSEEGSDDDLLDILKNVKIKDIPPMQGVLVQENEEDKDLDQIERKRKWINEIQSEYDWNKSQVPEIKEEVKSAARSPGFNIKSNKGALDEAEMN